MKHPYNLSKDLFIDLSAVTWLERFEDQMKLVIKTCAYRYGREVSFDSVDELNESFDGAITIIKGIEKTKLPDFLNKPPISYSVPLPWELAVAIFHPHLTNKLLQLGYKRSEATEFLKDNLTTPDESGLLQRLINEVIASQPLTIKRPEQPSDTSENKPFYPVDQDKK